MSDFDFDCNCKFFIDLSANTQREKDENMDDMTWWTTSHEKKPIRVGFVEAPFKASSAVIKETKVQPIHNSYATISSGAQRTMAATTAPELKKRTASTQATSLKKARVVVAATSSSAKVPTNKVAANLTKVIVRKGGVSSSNATANEDDMLQLLKNHNKRFAPVPKYEPPRHSVRDVRQWEKQTGKLWSSLKPDEREQANIEISQLKKDSASR